MPQGQSKNSRHQKLPLVQAGEAIQANAWNQIVGRLNESLRRDIVDQWSYSRWRVQNTTGAVIPAYSCVPIRLQSGTVFDDGHIIWRVDFDSPQRLVTNGNAEIPIGGEFMPIGFEEPQQIEAASGQTWTLGEEIVRTPSGLTVETAETIEEGTLTLFVLTQEQNSGKVFVFQPVSVVSGGGGGGGGGDCCCSCVVVEPNLLHPGGFVTVRNWLFTLESHTGWGRVAADNGWIRIKAGSYEVIWNENTAKWEYDLQVADAEFRNDGGDIETPLTVTGQITTEWVSETDPVVTRIEWDGTGNTFTAEAPPP